MFRILPVVSLTKMKQLEGLEKSHIILPGVEKSHLNIPASTHAKGKVSLFYSKLTLQEFPHGSMVFFSFQKAVFSSGVTDSAGRRIRFSLCICPAAQHLGKRPGQSAGWQPGGYRVDVEGEM